MLNKTYPQCEVCYIAENSKWEPESVGDDGSLVSKLIAVAVPLKLSPGSINVCCDCGEITIAGIYVEKDEDAVQYDSDPLEIHEDD
jgi:hypothetical protein